MLSIYRSLLNHAYAYSGKSKIGVVLHSSCVLSDELEEMFRDRIICAIYDFYVFEDSFYELSLFRHSRISGISANAALIIERVKKFENYNVRDCYGKIGDSGVYNIIRAFRPGEDNSFIFVFCDASSADEFVMNVIPDDTEIGRAVDNNVNYKVYDYLSILSFDVSIDGIDAAHSHSAPVPLSAFSRNKPELWKMRQEPTVLIRESDEELDFDKLNRFYIYEPFNGKRKAQIPKKNIEVTFSGNHARFCTVKGFSEYENKLLKIFKKPSKSKEFYAYIEKLIRYNRLFADRIALPEAIVYASDMNEEIHLVGFVMPHKRCTQVKNLFMDPMQKDMSDDFFDSYIGCCRKYAAQTALLLAEMRLFGLSMTDVSGANICIDDDKDNIYMVDADSIEPEGFVFKRWIYTPGYGYKGIFNAPQRKYYYPIYLSEFSFAVLLFNIYFRSSPLENNGRNHDRKYANWKEAYESFERVNCVTMYDAWLHPVLKKLWCEKFSDESRISFLKTFNEDKIYSLGQWVKILSLR